MFARKRKVDNYEGEQFTNSNPKRNIKSLSTNKKLQSLHPTTITIANITKKNEENRYVTTNTFLRVLMDSGCSDSLIKRKWSHLGKMEMCKNMAFITGNGTKTLNKKLQLEFTLCEFTTKRRIKWNFIVDEGDHCYDIIMGRDLLCELGIKMDFEKRVILWHGMIIPMRVPEKDFSIKSEEHLAHEYVLESKLSLEATDRVQEILDIKHEEEVDIAKWVQEIPKLNQENRKFLFQILTENEQVFQGDLGLWNCAPIDIELKENIHPYAARPFPVAKIHEDKFKAEIQRFVDLGILKRTINSEWASPAFLIPKKDGNVRFLCDFRQLNLRIKKKPYPIPPISDLLGKMEQFTYVTAIDISLGYHHIPLTSKAQQICTITTPYGQYSYTRLPMGLATAPSIFQNKIHELIGDLPYIRAYIDDILIISFGDARDHLQKLRTVLERLRLAGLKIKKEKVQLLKDEMIYLGYKISTKGISPDPTKVKAILNLDRPKTMKQVKRFIGMIQYYRDIWPRRSHVLAPIVDLTKGYTKNKKNKRIQWTQACEKAFKDIKALIAKETMLAFPDFSKKFTIHTDASDLQLGAVISQEGRPLAFYSRKLSQAQKNYTVTEKELLSIVETLKEFRTILLGFEIEVFTDHVNLTYNSALSESQRVMRWRMIIEEFSPIIKYIKGEANTVADSLSRLPLMTNEDTTESEEKFETLLNEIFLHDDDDEEGFPLEYTRIRKAQEQDLSTKRISAEKIENDKSGRYGVKMYDNERLMTYRGRIYVPPSLTTPAIQWYHWILQHPGKDKLLRTLQMHCAWPGMQKDIEEYTKACRECQLYKKRTVKYGKLPPKQLPPLQPWNEVAVDLIGPYTISTRQRQVDGKIQNVKLILCAMTMIDTATGWFEIREVPTAAIELKKKPKKKRGRPSINDEDDIITKTTIMDKSSARISQLFDQTWLSRYPRPTRVIFDNGVEFKKDFLPLLKDYGIKPVTTTIKNPQANAILERVHLVIHNMIRTHELDNIIFDALDPWSQILAQVAFAIRCSHHRTLEASPAQLVHHRDMIFNIAHTANWSAIQKSKQQQINKDNERENKSRVSHDYAVGDKVLIIPDGIVRKYEWKYEGPFEITQVYTNGTVRIQRKAYTERINIRRLMPYIEKEMKE
ncbi:hypothetical protein CTEN210_12744 [Chaetoceros tenuissimus]|uniref:Reverse transcriptase n=1 Tax=Chaetoceros tenuissimus TaxID=426638 RepID=A0AAD3HAT0_9STRA|nr:hypothetical protein CTEN210_12744 [Chaetoceros tenuissimus]